MNEDGTDGHEDLAGIRIVMNGSPTADELLEMVRTYAEEQRSSGRQAMAGNTVGSVQWLHGLVLAEAMTALLAVMKWKG